MTDSGWNDSTGLPPAESDGCGAEVDSPDGGRLSKPATGSTGPESSMAVTPPLLALA